MGRNYSCTNEKEEYSIDKLLKLIEADTIIKDVYEESKTLFGVVFTDCVNDLRTYWLLY